MIHTNRLVRPRQRADRDRGRIDAAHRACRLAGALRAVGAHLLADALQRQPPIR
jgi:hypothetical protein